MSAKGNRGLGLVNGSESYHTLHESFQSLFKEVIYVITTGKIYCGWPGGQEMLTGKLMANTIGQVS